MGLKHYIRLTGDHTSHPDGTVLGVVDHEHQVNNASVVHRPHALDLVKKGLAYWVSPVSSEAPAHESHADMVDRHAEEHADMLARHATEHREQQERHMDEFKTIAAAAIGASVGITGL